MSDFDLSYDYNLGYDYVNSFVQWDQNTADTTPRCALHASCKIRGKGEEFREYFLSHPCAGEKMYAEKNIIAQPTMEFHIVFCDDGQFMLVKQFDDSPGFERMSYRVGDIVGSKTNIVTTIDKMGSGLRYFVEVAEMTSYQEVHDAMVDNKPILGRTRYLTSNGDEEIEVVAEYPVTVMNARHEHDSWQVDTGPMLLPDFSIDHELEVSIFRQAYVVYNRWDYAEYAMRLPVKIQGASYPVLHYTNCGDLGTEVRNQLYVVKVI
jgi:hypothetical protein